MDDPLKLKEREKEADEVLQSAPPGTPPWALGVTFFVSTFLASFLGLYVAMSPDIKAYFSSRTEIRKQEITAMQGISDRDNASILQIVSTYSSQVADLSKLVGNLQQERNDLGVKVATLTREVEEIKRGYASCEAQLESLQQQHK